MQSYQTVNSLMHFNDRGVTIEFYEIEILDYMSKKQSQRVISFLISGTGHKGCSDSAIISFLFLGNEHLETNT